MDASGDRLEVMNRQRVRVLTSVPSDDVERMVRVDVFSDALLMSDEDGYVFSLDDQRFRSEPEGLVRRMASARGTVHA